MGHVVNYINLYIHQGFSNNTVLDALNILPERSVKFDVYLQNFQIKNSNKKKNKQKKLNHLK